MASIPGSGSSPRGGNDNPLQYSGDGSGYPLQYSSLENSMDREAWWAIVQRVAKESDMTEYTHSIQYISNINKTYFY